MINAFKRKDKKEIIFDIFNTCLMIFICFITLYPIWYTLVLSFNDGTDAMLGGIYWWPRKFSLESYKAVFQNIGIIKAFGVTIARTVIGTVTNVLFTAMVAYAFSKKDLVGRKVYLTIGIITMFFNGGLIPNFLLMKNLGLLDSFWVYIFPTMFNFFNLIIFVSFFKEIPKALEESVMIDGANHFVIFWKIILPLSAPVIATIALFTGVFHWNDYFFGVIYINNPDLQPIQTYLYKVIAQATSNQMLMNAPGGISKANITSTSIKLATMVITTFPIVCVYPFLQKYFVKGMLLGSVKG
ncbi:carbohydrate ABC transporter permease [Defluviitalea phaphyphila]|uniref:carbohydrate ABC transporter permease n=1 Tax=Defluviitalea phaphyphila TaxID=1473580 RepID=UPI00073040B4|nr:carbohydrate ABC transporter permease [Defluviitalea phaphyphila]